MAVRPRARLACLAGAAAVAAASVAPAAPAARAAGLREGFEAALPLSAPLRALEAGRAVPAARRERSESLVPGSPVLTLGWRSSQLTRDRGLREVEAEAAALLWLPGEARALRAAADAQAAEIGARIARQRLAVAGEVRAAWWDWAAADAARAALASRASLAAALERDAARQAAAGNAPEADRLAAAAALREAQAALREQELAARRSAIAFRTLTGLEPSTGPEERVAEAPAGEDPRAAAARAIVEAGQAAERLVRARDRANPEVGLQFRHERDAFGEPWGTRLAVLFTVPLQHPPVQRERLALARAAVASGLAESAVVDRALRGGLDRAREAREAALARAASAEGAYAATAERARLAEAAWRGGQLPLIEVVRARGRLAATDSARRLARAEAGRAASAINQALGTEPR